jgi:hypothetical protein
MNKLVPFYSGDASPALICAAGGDAIDVSTQAGLRHRALIALMVFSFTSSARATNAKPNALAAPLARAFPRAYSLRGEHRLRCF